MAANCVVEIAQPKGHAAGFAVIREVTRRCARSKQAHTDDLYNHTLGHNSISTCIPDLGFVNTQGKRFFSSFRHIRCASTGHLIVYNLYKLTIREYEQNPVGFDVVPGRSTRSVNFIPPSARNNRGFPIGRLGRLRPSGRRIPIGACATIVWRIIGQRGIEYGMVLPLPMIKGWVANHLHQSPMDKRHMKIKISL